MRSRQMDSDVRGAVGTQLRAKSVKKRNFHSAYTYACHELRERTHGDKKRGIYYNLDADSNLINDFC